MPGIDRIRIAQPGFDLGDGQSAGPRLDRRRGRGPRQARRPAARPSAAPRARHSLSVGASCSLPAPGRCVSCIRRCSQREAMVGAPSALRRGSAARRGPAASMAKSCAARPMPRSGCSSPSVARMGRENQGSAPAACGQVPSFKSAQNGEVETLQPRFQRAQNGQARMLAEGGAHRRLHRQAAEQRRHRSRVRWRASPAAATAATARTTAPRLRHRHRARAGSPVCSSQASASAAARCAASRSSSGDVALREQLLPAAPGARRSRPPVASAANFGSGGGCGAGRWRWPWQCRPGPDRDAGRASTSGPARAPGRETRRRPRPRRAKGCLSNASSGTGAKCASAASASRQRKAPALVWASGRPAESSMAMSQRAISAATRRARLRSGVTSAAVRPGCFQRLAQGQRDRQRFLRRIGGRRPARCRPGRCAMSPPPLRPARARHRWWARAAGFRAARSRAPDWAQGPCQSFDLLARRRRCVSSNCFRPILRMAGIELVPAFVIQFAVQPRQHHRAVAAGARSRPAVRRWRGSSRSSPPRSPCRAADVSPAARASAQALGCAAPRD